MLWGARLPMWTNTATFCGLMLWISLVFGHGTTMIVRYLLVRGSALSPAVLRIDRRFERRALVALAVSLCVLLFPLPMYVGFALNRSAFDRAAAGILAQPFTQKPEGRWVGVYYIDYIDRCPHGLQFSIRTYDVLQRERRWVASFV
jgi:hypothetical protein